MGLSANSTLGEVLADPQGLAVLEKHLPGSSTDKRVKLMKKLTLKQLQPMSGGMVSKEMLEQIDADLRALD